MLLTAGVADCEPRWRFFKMAAHTEAVSSRMGDVSSCGGTEDRVLTAIDAGSKVAGTSVTARCEFGDERRW